MPIALVTVTKDSIGGTAPLTSLDLPDDLSDFSAEHVRNVMAVALKNDDYVRNNPANGLANKVSRTGDTMTGKLIITPTTANADALAPAGNGTGVAIDAAPGTAQTNTAPTCAIKAAGYIQATGTDPNSDVNPGANNALHGANITKAWGTVSLTGGSPYSLQDGYNVTSVTEPIANIYQINFVRPFANNTYAITFTPHSVGTGVSVSSKTTTYCRFNVWETDAPGTPYAGRTVDFVAVGRQ